MAKLSIAILAAEPSGDLQAAALVRSIRQLNPEVEFFGLGGNHLRQEGVELLEDSSLWSVVGPFEAIPRIPDIWRRYHRMREDIVGRKPTLTVLIDAPAINMRLAKYLRLHNLRTAYYFPPSAWSPREARLREIHSKVDAVIPTFAYNAEGYQRLGLEVAYFGHPLVDLFSPLSPLQALENLGMPGSSNCVALLPGSRTQEIRYILPTFLEVARRLRRYDPSMEFLLPVATPAIRPSVEEVVGSGFPGLHLLSGQSKEALAASRLALIASGSATLEAALLNIPMILCYRSNWFDYILGRTLIRLGLLHIPRWGLPNLVLQEDIMPEVLQLQANPGNLTRMALDLLESDSVRGAQLQGLSRVRQSLGRPGVVPKVAQFVYQFAQGRSLVEARQLAEQL